MYKAGVGLEETEKLIRFMYPISEPDLEQTEMSRLPEDFLTRADRNNLVYDYPKYPSQYRGLEVKAYFAPLNKADVSIPNLRSIVEEQINKDANNRGLSIYRSFDMFLEAMRMFVPGEVSEDGIYVNITYSREALGSIIEKVAKQTIHAKTN